MASKRILVTGGAGFIGSHLVDALVRRGHAVTVLDALLPQVHPTAPTYLNPQARYVRGDVRDAQRVIECLQDQDLVYHLASAVGVGQSMYRIAEYADANVVGTAQLLEALSRKDHDVRKLVVASSMSLYGEGAYRCVEHGPVSPGVREVARLARAEWEPRCPSCAEVLVPVPTPETKPLDATSIYAATKKDQEEYSLMVGKTYGIPTVALRLFNVYGPRQQLSNPYTGVCAIFIGRIKNRRQPVVYEDGGQTRDFVSVHDVVAAFEAAADHPAADYRAINVGTGRATSIADLAGTVLRLHGASGSAEISGAYRAGDIRHCVADITQARQRLDYAPKWSLEEGLRELVDWSREQDAEDRFDAAQGELRAHGLLP